MAVQRAGSAGLYWGSPIGQSEQLSSENQGLNVIYIYTFLRRKGWTTQAIAATLGNMQAESSINPGRWQSDDVGNTSLGYGLVQWTPSTKYTEWCNENGYTDYSEMDSNLYRILYEVENNIQWIGTGEYSSMTFSEYSQSKKDVSYLAKAFLLCYERPADQSESVQEYRASLALNWLNLIVGLYPDDLWYDVIPRKRKNKYKFILFKRRSFLG